MGPNFRQYEDVSEDAQAHVGAANTGLGPMFWVCSGHTPQNVHKSISSDSSKKTICMPKFGWNLHHDGVWKGDSLVLQTWRRMVEFSNACEKENDCFWSANDNDWPSDGF